MSDNYLRYVPSDPRFQPTRDAAAAAEALLRSLLPQARTVASIFYEQVEFVDAGANWSGVHCPECGADTEDWWRDAMSEAWKSHFAALAAHAPCCGATVSLNELKYVWPVAFGRFVLEAANPFSKGLSAPQLEELGAVLGSPVREIPVHL